MIRQLDPKQNGHCKLVALPAGHSSAKLDHVSASSLKLYLTCSLKYRFKKVLGLEEPTGPSLHLGKAVHAGLQAFHLGRWRGQSHDLQTVLQAYEHAFLDPEEIESIPFKDEKDRDKCFEQGKNLVNAYLESDHASMSEIPRGVEVRLESEFKQIPYPLLGYVDLVREGNIPVDFKTCAATPNLDLEAFQHELQLTAYQLLIEEATGEKVEGRELVFLVKTKTPKIVVHRLSPATESDKDRFWSMVGAALDGIHHVRFYPQPGMHCSWCHFRKECAAWKGGGV